MVLRLKVNAVNIYDYSLPKFDYITKYVFENMYGYIKRLLRNSLYTHFNHCKQNKSYSMIIYTKTHSVEHSSVSKRFTLLPVEIDFELLRNYEGDANSFDVPGKVTCNSIEMRKYRSIKGS